MTDPEMDDTVDLEARLEDIRVRLSAILDAPPWTTDTFSGLLAAQGQTEELLRASYRTEEEWADPSRALSPREIRVATLATIEARQAWIEDRQAELLAAAGGLTPEQADARRAEFRAVMELPPTGPDRRDLLN